MAKRTRVTDRERFIAAFIKSAQGGGGRNDPARLYHDVPAAAEGRGWGVHDGVGFEGICVETVGVGQSDLTVTEVTDTTVLLLVPESGDSVQVLKAGILEVADLFVVNKADRSGADYLAKELRGLAEIREAAASPPRPGGGRNPQVLKTVATENTGVVELVDALETLRE